MSELLLSIPKSWKLLPQKFFARSAPVVAHDLVGCVLLKKIPGGYMGGVITETEAYTEDDEASHTFRGETPRNASMFGLPSTLYVYRSYGIHWCLNLSTGKKGRGEGVLIRALDATFGTDKMIPGASPHLHKLCSGPGRLCAALSIDKSFDGQIMGKGEIFIYQTPPVEETIRTMGQRIGISKAVEKHWRFGLKGNPSLSRPFPRET